MSPVILILLAVAAFGLSVQVTFVAVTIRYMRRSRVEPLDTYPPVSLLKPVKGLEDGLEGNLRALFEQVYPGAIEIIFASAERRDPGIALARRVALDYPEIPTRFAVSDPDYGLNPKVSNLIGAIEAARHDLVLQSDANVRPSPDYLRQVVTELTREQASLLSSIVVGVGEQSAGAALENLQLSAFMAPATMWAATVPKVPCVIGKSMLFRRGEIAELGGIDQFRNHLAEDFLIGRLLERMGRKVILSPTPIHNYNTHVSVDTFISRHARWLKMRAVLHVSSFVADVFTNPVPFALAACLLSGFAPSLCVALAITMGLKMTSDAWLLRKTRGSAMSWPALALAPIRDLCIVAIWPYAAFSRSVEWRGVRLRFGADTRLYGNRGALPVRVLRRVFAPFRGA